MQAGRDEQPAPEAPSGVSFHTGSRQAERPKKTMM